MFSHTECTGYVLFIHAILIHQSYLFLLVRGYRRNFLRSLDLKDVFLHDFPLFLYLQSLRTICNSLISQNLTTTVMLVELFLQGLLHLIVYFTAIYLLDSLVELFLLLLVTHPYVISLIWKSLVLILLKSRWSIFIFHRIVVFVFVHIEIILLIQNIYIIKGTFRRRLIGCPQRITRRLNRRFLWLWTFIVDVSIFIFIVLKRCVAARIVELLVSSRSSWNQRWENVQIWTLFLIAFPGFNWTILVMDKKLFCLFRIIAEKLCLIWSRLQRVRTFTNLILQRNLQTLLVLRPIDCFWFIPRLNSSLPSLTFPFLFCCQHVTHLVIVMLYFTRVL